VYKLTCPDCNKSYIGQTRRRFSIHYNENKKKCHNNTHTSSFAQHFHEHAISFGNEENVRQVIQHQKKGARLNTVEKFYIDSGYMALQPSEWQTLHISQFNFWHPPENCRSRQEGKFWDFSQEMYSLITSLDQTVVSPSISTVIYQRSVYVCYRRLAQHNPSDCCCLYQRAGRK